MSTVRARKPGEQVLFLALGLIKAKRYSEADHALRHAASQGILNRSEIQAYFTSEERQELLLSAIQDLAPPAP